MPLVLQIPDLIIINLLILNLSGTDVSKCFTKEKRRKANKGQNNSH